MLHGQKIVRWNPTGKLVVCAAETNWLTLLESSGRSSAFRDLARFSPAHELLRLGPEPLGHSGWIPEAVAIIARIEDEKIRLLFRTAAEAGMRPGELIGMRRTDIVGRQVSLSQSVYRGQIQTPKTLNAVRTFTISQRLIDDLQKYIAKTSELPNPDKLVWFGNRGTPVDLSKILVRVINPIIEELGLRAKLKGLGIKKCGFYPLRHMNITEMRRRNVPLKTIQNRVGEAVLQTPPLPAVRRDLKVQAALVEYPLALVVGLDATDCGVTQRHIPLFRFWGQVCFKSAKLPQMLPPLSTGCGWTLWT